MPTERTFGARLANAQDLISHLQSFSGYKPNRKSESIADLEQLVADIKVANPAVVTAEKNYSDAVEARQQAFFKDGKSIKKLVKPIRSAVNSTFGKKSTESETIGKLIAKIQGEKPVKIKDGDKEKTISQSQRSFGSITENFSSIVTLLDNKGSDYAPANTDITVASLKAFVATLPAINHNVATTDAVLSQKRDSREALYNDLAERVSRVKDAVKSQYGEESSEWAMVKNIK